MEGLLTKEQEDFIVDLIYDKVNVDNWFFKLFKRPIITKVVRAVDDWGLDYIPDTWKQELRPIVTDGMNKDWAGVQTKVDELINKEIDLKGIDEAQEAKMIELTTKTIAAWVGYLMMKK